MPNLKISYTADKRALTKNQYKKKRFTVDSILSLYPCSTYDHARLRTLFKGRKFLTPAHVLKLPIRDLDILWLLIHMFSVQERRAFAYAVLRATGKKKPKVAYDRDYSHLLECKKDDLFDFILYQVCDRHCDRCDLYLENVLIKKNARNEEITDEDGEEDVEPYDYAVTCAVKKIYAGCCSFWTVYGIVEDIYSWDDTGEFIPILEKYLRKFGYM